MSNIFTISRNALETLVRTFGYTDKEVRAMTTGELQYCALANLDQPEADWSSFSGDDLS